MSSAPGEPQLPRGHGCDTGGRALECRLDHFPSCTYVVLHITLTVGCADSMTDQPIHTDSIDLLVTAAVTIPLTAGTAESLSKLAESADHLGQQLRDAHAAALAESSPSPAPPAARYRWQPVAELVASNLDEGLLLQLERTRMSFVSASCNQARWQDSPARRFTDSLAEAICARLERNPGSPAILTSAEIDVTTADWRRPTIYARDDLADAHTESS